MKSNIGKVLLNISKRWLLILNKIKNINSLSKIVIRFSICNMKSQKILSSYNVWTYLYHFFLLDLTTSLTAQKWWGWCSSYALLSLFNFYIPPQQYSFKVYHFNPDGLKAHNLSQWVKVKPWASSQYVKLIMAQNNTHAQPNIVYNRPSSQYIKSFFQLHCYHHWRPHH